MSDNDKERVIPAGELFSIVSGEYSDYTIHGIFRAKATLNCDLLLREYTESRPGEYYEKYHASRRIMERKNIEGDEGGFIAWMLKGDLIDLVQSFEWRIDGWPESMIEVGVFDAATWTNHSRMED